MGLDSSADRPSARSAIRRQRGFAVYVVFMVILGMIMISILVNQSSQVDLITAGQAREQQGGLYGAEFAIASALDWLATSSINTISNTYSNAWTATLGAAGDKLCATVATDYPGTALSSSRTPVAYDTSGGNKVYASWCVHNNAADPAYFTASPNGNGNDSDGIIAIEGYGWAYGSDVSATSTFTHHVAAEVKVILPKTTAPAFNILSQSEQ